MRFSKRMSEHLTIDEMNEFLIANIVNDETIRMAYRVNEHINKCDECYLMYCVLLEYYRILSA